MNGVRKGRERLAVELPPEDADEGGEPRDEVPIFDQDLTAQRDKMP
jgi:hypothetical protein